MSIQSLNPTSRGVETNPTSSHGIGEYAYGSEGFMPTETRKLYSLREIFAFDRVVCEIVIAGHATYRVAVLRTSAGRSGGNDGVP
jgi:hypothetical protein